MGLDDGRDIGRARARTSVTSVPRRAASTSINPVYGAPISSPVSKGYVRPARPRASVGRPTRDSSAASNSVGTGSTGSTGSAGSAGSTGSAGSASGTATAPGAEATPTEAIDLGDEALNATLAAIAAQFGMTGEQLLADEGQAGRQYRQILAGMQQQQRGDLEATRDDLVARGILRSGETLENEARLAKGYAANKSAAQADRDFKLADIAGQKAALGPQQAAAEATAKASHARSELDLETLKALYGGGLA